MFYPIKHQFCSYTEIYLLSVSFESPVMIDCVYVSFPLSLHYPTINPEPGQNCGICTKAMCQLE